MAFSKEERVAFEDQLEKFEDALVISNEVETYRIGNVDAERANDTIWRPQPYITKSEDGMDQTGNFEEMEQLSVPSSINYEVSVPYTLNAKQKRDGLQAQRQREGAFNKLASRVNQALLTTAAMEGTQVVARAGAASGWDDVAECEAVLNEHGVLMNDRKAFYSTRDYNGMASDLAGRQTLNGKPLTAYDRAYIGQVAGFDTFKMDYHERLIASDAAGTTVNGANQRHDPKATALAANGRPQNVDNRYQTLTVAGANIGNIKAGDCFTIAGVESVHMESKKPTGTLKTFRVMSVNGADLTISPAIIAADSSPTIGQKMYQNVSATPANGAALTFLNTVTASANPFFHKGALEILPAEYAVEADEGWGVLRGTTENGITIVWVKQGGIDALSTKYRADCYFGTVMLQPEMAGIELFGQT